MILFNNSGVPFARKIQDSITVEVPAIYNEDGTLNETSTSTALQTTLDNFIKQEELNETYR